MIKKIYYIYELFFLNRIKIYNYVFKRLKLIIDSENVNFFITDHDTNKNLNKILLFLKEKNIESIALPHNVFIAKNKLRHNLFISKKDFEHDSYEALKNYDHIFLSNFIHKNFNNITNSAIINKTKVLKSLRYSEHWIDILSKEIYDKTNSHNVNDKSKIRLLILLPKIFNNVSYDELIRSIRILNDTNDFNII